MTSSPGALRRAAMAGRTSARWKAAIGAWLRTERHTLLRRPSGAEPGLQSGWANNRSSLRAIPLALELVRPITWAATSVEYCRLRSSSRKVVAARASATRASARSSMRRR